MMIDEIYDKSNESTQKNLIIRGKLFKINFLHRKWNAEQDQQIGTNSTIQEYLERGELKN